MVIYSFWIWSPCFLLSLILFSFIDNFRANGLMGYYWTMHRRIKLVFWQCRAFNCDASCSFKEVNSSSLPNNKASNFILSCLSCDISSFIPLVWDYSRFDSSSTLINCQRNVSNFSSLILICSAKASSSKWCLCSIKVAYFSASDSTQLSLLQSVNFPQV